MPDEKSRALPSSMYGDPALHYEREESKTCNGCKYEDVAKWSLNEVVVWFKFCTKARKHGKKCRQYKERE